MARDLVVPHLSLRPIYSDQCDVHALISSAAFATPGLVQLCTFFDSHVTWKYNGARTSWYWAPAPRSCSTSAQPSFANARGAPEICRNVFPSSCVFCQSIAQATLHTLPLASVARKLTTCQSSINIFTSQTWKIDASGRIRISERATRGCIDYAIKRGEPNAFISEDAMLRLGQCCKRSISKACNPPILSY